MRWLGGSTMEVARMTATAQARPDRPEEAGHRREFVSHCNMLDDTWTITTGL